MRVVSWNIMSIMSASRHAPAAAPQARPSPPPTAHGYLTMMAPYRRRGKAWAWLAGGAFSCPVRDTACCAVEFSLATKDPSTRVRRALALRRCSNASASQSSSSRQLGHVAFLHHTVRVMRQARDAAGRCWWDRPGVCCGARSFELHGGIRLRHDLVLRHDAVLTVRVGSKPLAHACGVGRHRAPRTSESCARGDDTRQRSRLSTGCWAAGARVFSMLSRQMQHSTPCGMGLGLAGGFASAIENKPGTVLSMGLGCCRRGATRAGDGKVRILQ